MSQVVTARAIRLDALGFPATATSRDGTTTVRADVPQAQLQAAVDSAPLDNAAANAVSVRQAAAGALDANRSFLAVATPTAAQVAAQVKALTRQNNALIRLVLGQLDGTD